MNGAESLIGTLTKAGVTVCFMNPGTSEIHFVAALDRAPAMRGVPCLFEGVASGAADGCARMTGKPACTLLHLGPGLTNALANLHNACRARVPLINIVGDHATFHRHFETPLASDIATLARPHSVWVRSSESSPQLGRDCAEAIAAARAAPGGIATLIVPADAAWGEGGLIADVPPIAVPQLPDEARIAEAAALIRSEGRVGLVLGAGLTLGRPLAIAGQIAAKAGAKLLAPFAFTRIERGADRPAVERIAYVTEQAIEQLSGYDALILLGAPPPVAFFGHPRKPTVLTSEKTRVFTLSAPDEDGAGALEVLAERVGAQHGRPVLQAFERPQIPGGDITPNGLAAVVAALLPENAIVVDESITSGRGMLAATASAPPHDWLVNTGGSIGVGMPLAVGAAVACPGRPVLCLEADGSGMYTLQALWTAARESLNIATVIFANRAYAILKGELAAASDNPGPRARDLLEIGRPDLDWVSLAKGMGVPASEAPTIDAFAAALRRSFAAHGPTLISVPL